eukprot:6209962-Pleurochrysis_carterae.AAC.4
MTARKRISLPCCQEKLSRARKGIIKPTQTQGRIVACRRCLETLFNCISRSLELPSRRHDSVKLLSITQPYLRIQTTSRCL